MAYYGIPSAGLVLTAASTNDTVSMVGLGNGTLITAQSIYGADGNDLISLGAVGRTATASAIYSGGAGALSGGDATGSFVVSLQGSALYSTSTTFNQTTGTFTTGAQVHGVVTADQAARTVNGAYFQGNKGNDSIAFGDSLTTVSATTFAGGAGNDFIGGATTVNETFSTTGNALSGATFTKVDIEGGNGNDTIHLLGLATYSALNVNSNVGNDKIRFEQASILNSVVGMGQGNDQFSGGATLIETATIAGGKGNDTIVISATNFESFVLGGDRANADNVDGDGNDSISITDGNTFSASTIYGGGGNDTVRFSATSFQSSFASLNDGNDRFFQQSGTDVVDSTIGLGKGNDSYTLSGAGTTLHSGSQILSSRINLGQGKDSIYFGNEDVASGTTFANTTIFGGAGNDYLLGSATFGTAGTTQTILEYRSDSESTISAYDTIALNVFDSGTYQVRYEVGGASLASFSAAGTFSLTGSEGVVTFAGNYATDVTARASAIAANTSTGNAAIFVDGSNNAYLFVNGSTDNLLVQVGSAAISGGADNTLAINAGKNFNVTLSV